MKRAILVGLAMVCLVIYLVLLNGESVDFRLTSNWIVHWNVGALIGGAFVVGVLATLTIVAVQAGHRAWRAWRTGRRERRITRIDQWEESGEQLIWNGDAQRGRALLQKAWQRRPENPHAVIALAASFQDTGEVHRARGVLFDAATEQHTNPDVLFALAEAHRLAGERGPRIEALERLRALHPRAPRVLRALRDAYADAERWHDAATVQDAYVPDVRDPQQALRERDQLVMLRYQAAMQLTDPAARLEALEALASSRAVPLPVLISLGDALAAANRPEEASAVWERALRTTPRTVLVERLAGLATETRHRDRIRTVLRKLRQGTANADALHLVNARLYLADRNLEETARELQAVQPSHVAPGPYHRLWAEVHRLRGQVEQALTEFARAAGASDDYRCQGCERVSPEWVGHCPKCRQWDSYRSAAEIGA